MLNKRICAFLALVSTALMLFLHGMHPTAFAVERLLAQSPEDRADMSADVSLRSITVSPKEIDRFDASATRFVVSLGNQVRSVSVLATPNHPRATVKYCCVTDLDEFSPGLQFEPVAGEVTTVNITVTAENGLTYAIYPLSIGRGTTEPFGWKADDDFDNVFPFGLHKARGIWSDGKTMWIANYLANTVYAFNMSDKLADNTLNIPLANDNRSALDIWSDGSTMWVADAKASKIFAYQISSQQRAPDLDIELVANQSASGIWSDGATIWVADQTSSKVYNYRFSDRTYVLGKDVTTAPGNELPTALWSDGNTVWVTDAISTNVYAYRISDWSRTPGYDFDLMFSASETFPLWDFVTGLWSDGKTMWISCGGKEKVFSYNMPDAENHEQRDATLRSLSVSPVNISDFASDIVEYSVSVGADNETATISAVANANNASVQINGIPIETGSDYQFDLRFGENEFNIKVLAPDSMTTSNYYLAINRGTTEAFGWKVSEDFNDLRGAGQHLSRSMWSDGQTMWVTGSRGFKLYAYRVADKQRIPDSDIHLSGEPFVAHGLWSDGTTLWLGRFAEGLIAFSDADGRRLPSMDIKLQGDNELVSGIWSNGETMWVSDYEKDKLFAYGLDDKQRIPGNDFGLSVEHRFPGGMWANDEILWVSDGTDKKLYAYQIIDKSRVPNLDFEKIFAGPNKIGGQFAFDIWSDGVTMWMVDQLGVKIFSYNMPEFDSIADSDATLSGLKVKPKNIGRLIDDVRWYSAGVGNDVDRAIIAPTATDSRAEIEIDGTTIEPGEERIVDLKPGANYIRVKVTAADRISSEDYTVVIGRAITEPFGWDAEKDFDSLYQAGNHSPEHIWSDGTTMWVLDRSRTLYAYRMSDGSREAEKEFMVGQRYESFGGIWSDGETMWFPRWFGETIVAYNIADKRRDPTKDLALVPENSRPTDLWSDGDTVWVADHMAKKIFAYRMSDMSRRPEGDFRLFERSPRAIWSDGETMWVFDGADVHPYRMSDKQPDSAKIPDPPSKRSFLFPDANTGMWSDGETMWIANDRFGSSRTNWSYTKIYAFNMPPKQPSDVDNQHTPPATGGATPARTMPFLSILIGALIFAAGIRLFFRDLRLRG